MFEDALVESAGRIKTRSRYYTIIGVLVNGSLLAGLVLVPLLYPDALPRMNVTSMLVVPSSPPPPAPAVRSPATPVTHQVSELEAPTAIPRLIRMTRDDSTSAQPAAIVGMENAANGAGAADLIGGLNLATPAPAVVKVVPPRKILVSQGVMAGNVIVRPEPAYPAIAKAARIQGVVVLAATISKAGAIENLTVVSGPPMLAQAALDAVRQWRYRPYLLNGQPVEVQTQVNVSFTLGG